MGYGWSVPEPDITPVLSTCDIAALKFVFAWAVEGVDPTRRPQRSSSAHRRPASLSTAQASAVALDPGYAGQPSGGRPGPFYASGFASWAAS